MTAATQRITQFESGHLDMVHDSSFDFYGKRLATCSSDRMIKIFDVVGDQVTHVSDLTGHEGPVWQVSWAHPKFGGLLASCSFDNRVIIWKEVADNVWQQVHQSQVHTSSVNSVAWAPHELGLLLAAGSSDGTISVLSYAPEGWHTEQIENAHPAGCTAVSWSAAAPRGSLLSSKAPENAVKRLASSGCDNTIKIWVHNEAGHGWQQQAAPLTGHTDWVRDVAWAPSLGLPTVTLASAGQDGKLIVWSEREDGQGWNASIVHEFDAPVWRVSWSVSGGVLAASDGNNNVTLWKQGADGRWQQLVQ